jgi:hypothetical protein
VNLPEIIIACIALLGGLASVVSTISLLQFRTAHMAKLEEDLRKDLKEALSKLNTLTTLVEVFSREQAIINKFATQSMDQLVSRVEWLEQISLKLQHQAGMTDKGQR